MNTLVNNGDKEVETNTEVDVVELDNLTAGAETGKSLLDGNLDVIKNVKVSLDVFLGSAELEVGDLFNLKSRSVVKLDQDISSPIDVRLENNVVARGELVAVDDSFGIRITEITSWK